MMSQASKMVFWKRALFIFLILKLFLVFIPLQTPDGGVLVDSSSYLDLAQSWRESGRYLDPQQIGLDLLRPPGYPALVIGAQAILTSQTWGIIAVQLLMLSLCSFLLVSLGSVIGKPVIGLVAGWLFALSPNATLWALTIMTEISFTTVLLGSAVLLVLGSKNDRIWLLGLSGLLLASAIYIRPIGMVLVPIWAAVLATQSKGNYFGRFFRQIAPVIFVIALLLLPWFFRNRIQHGVFAFSNVSQKTLLGFNMAEVLAQAEGIPRNKAVEQLEGSDDLAEEAFTLVREHPFEFAQVQILGLIRTSAGIDIGTWGNVLGWDTWKGFGLISRLFNREIDYGTDPLSAKGGMEGLLHRGLLLFSISYSGFLTLGAFLGGISFGNHASEFSIYWLNVLTVIVLLAVPLASGQARFRVPAEPFMALLAAEGYLWVVARSREKSWWRSSIEWIRQSILPEDRESLTGP